MDNFLTRLVDEQLELQSKLEKLSSFISSGNISNVELDQQRLLKMQVSAMVLYNEILKDRILLLTNNK